MESGNSGSLQSSSGGDEECDSSRAGAALSIFMNTHSPSHHHLLPISPPPPPFFEPAVSNYYIPNASSLDPIWPRPATVRSDPNPSSSHATIFAHTNDHLREKATAPARGSRKRSRATRRDPTTVLTTDTTNFRAMVQEFTGIPSPPFNINTSTTPSFDLFRTRTRSTHFEPPYLRPPPPPFLFSSTTPINNYQLPMPMQLVQSSNLFNDLRNPNTALTSLLQSNPKFMPTNDQFGDFDFNLDENQCFTALTGLPNLISPDKNSESKNREIKTAAVRGGKTTAAPVDLKGEGMVESWITSSE